MNHIALGVLLCLSSTTALAQSTFCSTDGNSMGCLTYGDTGNRQSSTTNCYRYGNSISCSQYAYPKIDPNGCGTPVGCAIQGLERGRQQAQQQRIQQERLEQLRLQNQLLQQQIDLEEENSESQEQGSQRRAIETAGHANTEPSPGADEGRKVDMTYAPATRTSVLEAEYCFGFGTAEVNTMQYRINQNDAKSDKVGSTKYADYRILQERSSDNAKLASFIIYNSNLADDVSLHKLYNDGVADYGKMRPVMDRARDVCSAGASSEWSACMQKIIRPEGDRLGSSICSNLNFLKDESRRAEGAGD